MIGVYTAGALVMWLTGQQSANEAGSVSRAADFDPYAPAMAAAPDSQDPGALLDLAMAGDFSSGVLMQSASDYVGLGVAASDAAIIVAVAGLAYKGLQMATPFFHTANDIWRKKALGEFGGSNPKT